MERSLKYERLFPLGQYVNVKFIDEINDLPDVICMNEELVSKIRYLQMVDAEISYRVYLKLYEKSKTLDLEELAKSMEFLEFERAETLSAISAILFPKPEISNAEFLERESKKLKGE